MLMGQIFAHFPAGSIYGNTLDDTVFVFDTLDAHFQNGATGHGRQQYPPQGIAEGMTKTAL